MDLMLNYYSGSHNVDSQCLTVSGGNVAHAPCVFPFNYAGLKKQEKKNLADVFEGVKNISSCVSTFPGEEPWCATQTDQNRDLTSGNWGKCGDECPGTHIFIWSKEQNPI